MMFIGGEGVPVRATDTAEVLDWPGPAPEAGAEVTFREGGVSARVAGEGAWGLLRLLDGTRLRARDDGARYLVDLRSDAGRVPSRCASRARSTPSPRARFCRGSSALPSSDRRKGFDMRRPGENEAIVPRRRRCRETEEGTAWMAGISNIEVLGPLPADIRFVRLSGGEEISRPFRHELQLLMPKAEDTVEVDAVLGKMVTVAVKSEMGTRFVTGFVDEFGIAGFTAGEVLYFATLRPWLWFLSKTHENRIFQNMSVVEIIEEVFGAYPDAAFEKRLRGTYAPPRVLRAVQRERLPVRLAAPRRGGHLLLLPSRGRSPRDGRG